jgi:hypothetical protein
MNSDYIIKSFEKKNHDYFKQLYSEFNNKYKDIQTVYHNKIDITYSDFVRFCYDYKI